MDVKTYAAIFDQGGCHDNDGHLLFPDHPPEVSSCVSGGSLGGYVLPLPASIALQWTERSWSDAFKPTHMQCVCVCVCVCVCITIIVHIIRAGSYLSNFYDSLYLLC